MRAWWPADFIPDKQGVQDLMAAFKGDTTGLLERGINVGCGVDPSTPGKMDENKAIYGSDGKGGKKLVNKTQAKIITYHPLIIIQTCFIMFRGIL